MNVSLANKSTSEPLVLAERSTVLSLVHEPIGYSEVPELFRQNGYAVVAPRKAAEAREVMLKNGSVGIVVADLVFDRVNIVEFMSELRRTLPVERRIKLVVLAEQASVNDVIAALRIEAVNFLRKPSHPHSLLAAVHRANEALMREAAEQMVIRRTTDLAEAVRAMAQHSSRPMGPVGTLGLDPFGADGAADPLPLTDSSPGHEMSEPMRRHAIAAVRARKLQRQIFGADFVATPHWDILLDLFVTASQSKAVSVSSLCIASGVPATTALRRIKELEDAGFVTRTKDDADARRVFVELTAVAYEKLQTYFRLTR